MAKYKGRNYSRTRAKGTSRGYKKSSARSNTRAKAKSNVGTRILCVVLALMILLASVLLVMEYCTPYKPSNGFKLKQTLASASGLSVESVEGEEGGISLTSVAVAQAKAPLKVDASHRVIEATVNASNLTSNVLDVKWSISAKTEEGVAGWYEGKEISDYIELKTPAKNASGGYTAAGWKSYSGAACQYIGIECKQAFGGVLEVTATSADDETVKTTVEINYIKPVESVTAYVTSASGDDVLIIGDETIGNDPRCDSNKLVIVPKYGVGTKEGTFTGNIGISLSGTYFGSMLSSAVSSANEYAKTDLGTASGPIAVCSSYDYPILAKAEESIRLTYSSFFVLNAGGAPFSALSNEAKSILKRGLLNISKPVDASGTYDYHRATIKGTVVYHSEDNTTEFELDSTNTRGIKYFDASVFKPQVTDVETSGGVTFG